MSDWRQIHERYLRGDIEAIIRRKTAYKMPLLSRVCDYARGSILETGCGTATSLIWLARRMHSVAGVDSDPASNLLARQLSIDANVNIPLVTADIGTLPFRDGQFSIAFSNGVMEHFDDERIRALTREQLRVAETVFLSVPSRQYSDECRTYGDERFMTAERWGGVLSPFRVIDRFGFHDPPSVEQQRLAPTDIEYYQFLCFVLQR